MFHMAYLVGSQIALRFVLGEENAFDPAANGYDKDVLLQVNLAHICTPVLNGLSVVANQKGYFVLEKMFDTISIF